MFYICFSIYIWNVNEGEEKVAKKVISIETGIQWTKVALVDYRKKNPPLHEAFAFRTPEHAVEDGYIRDKDSLARALKEELVRRQILEKDVVFTLSSSKVVTREVVIPYVKDNKIKGIIDAQSRDYFPMDISGYTISYSKMDVVEDDGKKQLKLLLVAIPDNLLGNYVSFAQLAGLKVETFDYIGNGCIQLMCDSFVDNAMIIQLEEQALPDPAFPPGEMYIMGEYVHDMLGRYILLYYGSFAALLGEEDEEAWREEIFATVAHEFTHHMEDTAMLHALDDKDAEFLRQAMEEYGDERD